MPFLAVLANPLVRKGLAIFGILGILGIAIWRIEAHGYNRAMAEVEAATAGEHERRESALRYMTDEWAPGAIKHVDELEQKNAELLQRGSVASAANDTLRSLPRGAVMRLNQLRNPDRR